MILRAILDRLTDNESFFNCFTGDKLMENVRTQALKRILGYLFLPTLKWIATGVILVCMVGIIFGSIGAVGWLMVTINPWYGLAYIPLIAVFDHIIEDCC